MQPHPCYRLTMPLRPLAESDLLTMLEWRNAPSVRENMYTKHEISEAEHRNWFARQKNDEHSRWYIYEDEMSKPQGVVYFTQYQLEQRNSFWGFYAGQNAKPGLGACMELDALDHAFTSLGLHKLNCEVIATNNKVVNLHKKFGFKEEGVFRDVHFNGKEFIDVIRLGILSSEWLNKRAEIIGRIARLNQTKSSRHG